MYFPSVSTKNYWVTKEFFFFKFFPLSLQLQVYIVPKWVSSLFVTKEDSCFKFSQQPFYFVENNWGNNKDENTCV